MINKWDKRYSDMAQLVSSWSKDPSTQVGAVIVRPDKSIASVGFNGFPRTVEDRHEWYADRQTKLQLIVHAEDNALKFCAHESVTGYTAYVYPLMPCMACAEKLMARGIQRVVTVTTQEKFNYMQQDDVKERYNFDAVHDFFAQHNALHEVIVIDSGDPDAEGHL